MLWTLLFVRLCLEHQIFTNIELNKIFYCSYLEKTFSNYYRYFLQGFNETVNSGTKIIFVLLPGVKEFLKQHSKTDITHAAIRRALKV